MSTKNIFLSYRRGTDGNAAKMLYDLLVDEFGRERIFFDIDTIPMGVDFHDYLEDQVGACAAFIAVIGPSWTAAIPRLARPDDFVRIEIEAALERRQVPVIPVLVDGAPMPKAEDLPPDLAKLPRRNGIDLVQQYFALIVREKLIPSLRSMIGDGRSDAEVRHVPPDLQPSPPPSLSGQQPWRGKRRPLVMILAGVMLLGILGISVYSQRDRIWGADDHASAPPPVDEPSIKTVFGTKCPAGTEALAAQIVEPTSAMSAKDAMQRLSEMGGEAVCAVAKTFGKDSTGAAAALALSPLMQKVMHANDTDMAAVRNALRQDDLDGIARKILLRDEQISTQASAFLSVLDDPRAVESVLAVWASAKPNNHTAYLLVADVLEDLALQTASADWPGLVSRLQAMKGTFDDVDDTLQNAIDKLNGDAL